jgi:UDP-glucose 4-epimerase|tara:strand:- start:5383 stop:6387 length:1005 start_codon:yes stop_codon:yes gene_type:complete
MKKTILITGVAGLLGSRLADWLIENTEHDVIGVDDLSGGYLENVNHFVDFYSFDLKELKYVDNMFEENKIDIVYHMAAYAAEGLSPFMRKHNYENNLIASTNLITNSIKHNVERFVFTSSMAVYGDKHTPPFHEDLLPSPIDPYGIAKLAVEQDLEVARRQHGLNYTVVRPHNFYGRNQNIWDRYRNVLGIWMYQIMNNIPPTIFGDGKQKRAFSYIDDALEPLWKASQSDECIGETINLGGVKEYTINEACNILLEVTGTDLKPVHLEPRHETKYAWSTWDKSVELLDFKHNIDLEEGLTKMWEWAQNAPEHKRKEWKNFELDKDIYNFWEKQ